MNINNIVQLIKTPTSSRQLSDMLDGNVKIMNYRQLRTYDNINDVLKPYDQAIILYETKLNLGHWVCLFRDGDVIEHFDSYGYSPDGELSFIPKNFKKAYYGKIPYLIWLLYKSKQPIRYNHYKLQKLGNNISTCGRWCIARLIFKHLDENKFAKLFYVKGVPRDFLVCAFTELCL